MLRRLAALLMLLTITFSRAESVYGMLRDGAIHHESNAAAAVHSIQIQGEHGHEDAAPQGPEPEHGPGHEHGTPADHCTHHHGNLITPPPSELAILAYIIPEVFSEPPSSLDPFSEPFFPPPQA